MVYFAFDIFNLIKDGIGSAIQAGIRTIFFEICSVVYGLIISLYDIFLSLCNAQLLDIDIIKDVSQRVGLILGLVMFFMVSFSFIQMVLDPEKMTDKEMGAANILKKVLIVIVLFGISPFIFDTLQTVQKTVISSNVLNRLLLPNNYEVNNEVFGKVIATNLFSSFYTFNEFDGIEDNDDYQFCTEDYKTFQNTILSSGDFESACVTSVVKYNEADGTDRIGFIMKFNYILALLVGIFVCYCFIMYTISVGMRVVQLAFLQMVSPMAFIAYLSPKKDNLFSKWLKMYAMTFLDVFIRIAIISLGVFLISIILDSWTDITATGDGFGSVFWHSVATCDANGENCEVSGVLYIKIIMIMAILSFMKKAPDLIKQLIPSSGANGVLSYGLSAKDNPGFGMGKAVVGGATAGVVGGVVSGVSRFNATRKALSGRSDIGRGKRFGKSFLAGAGGVITGVGRGAFAGSKKGNVLTNFKTGLENQRKMDNQYENLVAEGGSTLGKLGSKVTDLFTETKGQMYNRRIRALNKLTEYSKQMKAAADENSTVKSAKDSWQGAQMFENETPEQFEARKNDFYNRYKDTRNAFIEAALNNQNSFTYDGVTHNFLDDDKAHAAEIRSVVNQANSYSTANNVQVYNSDNNSWEAVGSIFKTDANGNFSAKETRSRLSDIENDAINTTAYINQSDEYARAVANDRAAGVSDRRNFGGKDKK